MPSDTELTPEEVDDLQAKYTEMLRMRRADLAGTEEDPRKAMNALAARFPGALREIDELPLESIVERLSALEAVRRDPARGEPWMKACALFHSLTRGALCAKKWLAGQKNVGDAAMQSFHAESASLCFGEEALVWAEDLPRLANPPRGRVTELVFERIARVLGISLDEARVRVFGEPRRKRRGSR